MICPPHGWEGIQFYETLQLLATSLAAAGFPTLRLHYDGTGESFGTDEDPDRVGAWTESIRRAVTAMKALPGAPEVGLVAVRMAALLAGAVASETEIARLVLWEPCVTGASYTREMEILASASPRAVQKEGSAGTSYGVEAGGYVLTRDTVTALGAIDLSKTTPLGKPDVLMICRDDRPPVFAKKLAVHLEGLGLPTKLEQLPGYKEAMTYPEKAKPGVVMIERIRDWAVERSQPIGDGASAADAAPVSLALAAEGAVLRTRRRAIRFGPDHRLFGVLTEPVTPPASPKRPVLMLTGGVVPRISVNRMYVVVAERLASMGHTVLRMDVSGICESPPAPGAAPNDPHAASLLGDAKAAVELLLAETKSDTIALLGLCSGAYASFQTALADPRVRNIVLLNPEVFHLKDGSPKFSETEQSHAARHYKESLLDPAKWKKLLTGKANLRYIAGFAVAKAKTTVEKAKERISARVTKAPQGLAGDLHRFATKGVKVTVVMAHGDSGYEALMSQLEAELDGLKRVGFRLELTPGPDHTFNDFSTREPLIEQLVEILSS
ncbi:MAG: hypothetical protein JST00_07110 [Deltaproteobacteria bacterium]|nr:hypothetical protein [Deltaproteobacteria bacterium]